MRRRTTVLALFCGLMAAPAVLAQDYEPAYDRSGWYVGVGGGVGLEMFGDEYRKPNYLVPSSVGGDGILSNVGEGKPGDEIDIAGIEPPFFTDPTCTDPNPDRQGGPCPFSPNATSHFFGFEIGERVVLLLRAGYRINDRWAVEGLYEIADEFDVRSKEDIPFRRQVLYPTEAQGDQFRETLRVTSTGLKLRPMVATANVKHYLLTGRFQPYLLGGVGAMFARLEFPHSGERFNKIAFAMRFGGGIEFYITESIVMTTGVTYVYPTGSLKDMLDYLSVEALGFTYRFGAPEE